MASRSAARSVSRGTSPSNTGPRSVRKHQLGAEVVVLLLPGESARDAHLPRASSSAEAVPSSSRSLFAHDRGLLGVGVHGRRSRRSFRRRRRVRTGGASSSSSSSSSVPTSSGLEARAWGSATAAVSASPASSGSSASASSDAGARVGLVLRPGSPSCESRDGLLAHGLRRGRVVFLAVDFAVRALVFLRAWTSPWRRSSWSWTSAVAVFLRRRLAWRRPSSWSAGLGGGGRLLGRGGLRARRTSSWSRIAALLRWLGGLRPGRGLLARGDVLAGGLRQLRAATRLALSAQIRAVALGAVLVRFSHASPSRAGIPPRARRRRGRLSAWGRSPPRRSRVVRPGRAAGTPSVYRIPARADTPIRPPWGLPAWASRPARSGRVRPDRIRPRRPERIRTLPRPVAPPTPGRRHPRRSPPALAGPPRTQDRNQETHVRDRRRS